VTPPSPFLSRTCQGPSRITVDAGITITSRALSLRASGDSSSAGRRLSR
jgi:hypothetical protein